MIPASLSVLAVLTSVLAAPPSGASSGRAGTARVRVAATSGSAVELVATAPGTSAKTTPSLAADVAHGEQQFSVALLRQLSSKTPATKNLVVSPSSLATALAMLDLGARNGTAGQIAQVLGMPSTPAVTQAAGWAALDAQLNGTKAPRGATAHSADSLWLQHGLTLRSTFMDDLRRYFSTGVWEVDFAGDPAGAAGAINGWVRRETLGHIPTLYGPGTLSPTTMLILANAVYFKADWLTAFSKTTTKGPFTTTSGASITVPYLNSAPGEPLDVPCTTNATETAVTLPYVGGRFSALVVMPKSGSLAQYVDGLTVTGLDGVVSSLQPTAVDLSMPSVTLTASHDLTGTLQSLGMTDAFGPDADLSGIGPSGLRVTGVVQKATLDVTAWGTVATAATGIAVGTSARTPSKTLTINRPYLFFIRDTATGTILFAARISHP
jgi:serpin B